jgi:nucleoside-diphosphate-sugar epimerase
MQWSGKNVLVTGAGGFIGSHLCEALIDLGAEVTGMIRYTSRSDWGNLELLPPEGKAALRVVAGNIEDSAFVNGVVKGKDVVFHLAALIAIPYSYIAPASYVRTNVEGTLNIMEAARTFGTSRVVHTSTSETYGTAIYTPIDEKHPLQGQSPYSASKIGAGQARRELSLLVWIARRDHSSLQHLWPSAVGTRSDTHNNHMSIFGM